MGPRGRSGRQGPGARADGSKAPIELIPGRVAWWSWAGRVLGCWGRWDGGCSPRSCWSGSALSPCSRRWPWPRCAARPAAWSRPSVTRRATTLPRPWPAPMPAPGRGPARIWPARRRWPKSTGAQLVILDPAQAAALTLHRVPADLGKIAADAAAALEPLFNEARRCPPPDTPRPGRGRRPGHRALPSPATVVTAAVIMTRARRRHRRLPLQPVVTAAGPAVPVTIAGLWRRRGRAMLIMPCPGHGSVPPLRAAACCTTCVPAPTRPFARPPPHPKPAARPAGAPPAPSSSRCSSPASLLHLQYTGRACSTCHRHVSRSLSLDSRRQACPAPGWPAGLAAGAAAPRCPGPDAGSAAGPMAGPG